MADPRPGSSDRLDSWKAIADHLGREVRTVRRWEQKLGLPVRRVPGGRGHSVFAYVSEIDAWLKANPPAHLATANGNGEDKPNGSRARAWQWRIAAGMVILVGAAGAIWRMHPPALDAGDLTFQVKPGAILGLGPSGEERWRHSLPDDEIAWEVLSHSGGPAAMLEKGGGVIVGLETRSRKSNNASLPGQLLWFTRAGQLRKTFSFQKPVSFGTTQYKDWIIIDFHVREQSGRRQIAVCGRDYRWWPSLVTVLDDNLEPRGTFVNAGWIQQVRWLAADRLLVSGYFNPRKGGMVALLDTNALDGQSPPSEDRTYECTSCGSATPLRYVVFPRSEVNRVTGSDFNFAVLEIEDGHIVARTVELKSEGAVTGAEVLYQLTPSLDIVGASYSDRYWEWHQALERQGKIHHSRAACPDRDGPRSVEVWDRARGWRTVALPR